MYDLEKYYFALNPGSIFFMVQGNFIIIRYSKFFSVFEVFFMELDLEIEMYNSKKKNNTVVPECFGIKNVSNKVWHFTSKSQFMSFCC